MKVIELVSQGDTVTHACKELGLSYSSFKRLLKNSTELQEALEQAEQEGADTLSEILLRIDTDEMYGSSDPQKMKILSENIKWYLAKKHSKRFGEKIAVEHTISADRAITEALLAGIDRAHGRQIEHVVQDAVFEVVESVVTDEASVMRAVMPDALKKFF